MPVLKRMQGDIKTLGSDVRSLDKKVGSLEHKVGSLEHKVDKLDKRVGVLEQKMDAHAAEQIVMHKKIDALFDVWDAGRKQSGYARPSL